MDDAPHLMTAADCARRIGTTVRALRVYEEHGLLQPRRSASNWRIYGARELTRLNEILAFKSMGFSLGQIKELIAGQDSNPKDVLTLQLERLAAQQRQIDRSVKLVSGLHEKTVRGEILSIDDLLDLAKETQMNDISKNDIAWKRYEQMRPRVEIELPVEQLKDYVGYFKFDESAALEIMVEGQHAWLRMAGQPRVRLFAEGNDQFFLKVVPAQVSFHRTDGAVNSLTLHQNGLEMQAARSNVQQFDAIEELLTERASRDIPRPNSAAALERIIEEHRLGKPDYEAMTAELAAIVEEQLQSVVDELSRLGAFVSLTFLHVDGQGFDVFDVTFENGVMEFGLSEKEDGVYDGLYMRLPSNRAMAATA